MSIFDIADKRDLKRFNKTVEKINALGETYEKMSDDELKAMTGKFRKRLSEGETLDDLLPEAFATVREASFRVLGLKHYDVQLIGGMVLHEGRIAEMKTGEGKTLVATCPVYLNALEGKGVHVVTVNDYLAKRDRDQMAKVYEFLGLTVGVAVHDQASYIRKQQYDCDITYGTNNEFGFDYLRDNMVSHKDNKVQRGLNYAIVDEVDSILIDEARTPLIISGPGDNSTNLYRDVDVFITTLARDDYEVEEKEKTSALTEQGVVKAEKYFNTPNLTGIENTELYHHIRQALKAHFNMKRDIDYVVKDGEIIIVDEFTGRLMDGRRYSEGLHQAIEAKEGVEVQPESKTMATITFQNYFRMYNKLSGMTGTAKTEENEFTAIYKMDVMQIPTNKPVVREDLHDVVYINQDAKFNAIADEVERRHKTGQPILVGTVSIRKSEALSEILTKRGIEHQVLNAKNHEKEAEIVAQAGRFGAVTIATNMAGRGTDIVLGGNPAFMTTAQMRKMKFTEELLNRINFSEETAGVAEDEIMDSAREMYRDLLDDNKKKVAEEKVKVIDAGGLCIIGTERHESRRIDNQLRGRSGRQGDPGTSIFFLALDDDLMRLFGSDKMQKMVSKFGVDEKTPLRHRMLTKSIVNAQRKVEGRNFGIRKNTVKYDDVINKQRTIVYDQRNMVLNGLDIHDKILEMLRECISSYVNTYPDWDELKNALYKELLPKGSLELNKLETLARGERVDAIYEIANLLYSDREINVGKERFRDIERAILLEVVDKYWINHIDAMDQLRQFIGLRALGQQDPIYAYKIESSKMFNEMSKSIRVETVHAIFDISGVNIVVNG